MYVEKSGTSETMMPDEAKGKSPQSIRLPKFSPVARLILFIGIFLVIAIPLYLILSQQQAKQAELNQQYSILQKATGKQESPEVLKKGIEAEISSTQKELATAKTVFPNPDQSPEIIDNIMTLAKANGIEITKTLVSASHSAITVGNDTIEYPVLNFDITFKGQVPKFQNFLLALNSRFPTSELKKVYFRITEKEDEEDTANIVISVYSTLLPQVTTGEIPVLGKKPVASFTDKKDKTTDVVKIKNSKWRIDWKMTATDSKWAGFNLIIYRKGETGRYVSLISRPVTNPEGTEYVSEGEGNFYIKVMTANVSNWEIRIYE